MLSNFSVTCAHDLEEAKEFTKFVRQSSGRALDYGLRNVSRMLRGAIRGGIAGDKSPKLTRGSRRKRQIGKLAGAWPEVPAYGGRKPLYRSRLLAQSIDWEKVTTYEYIVGVMGGVAAPHNNAAGARTMDQIAVMQETGWARTFPVTQRMRAYLMILYGRATGSKGKGRSMAQMGDEPTGTTIAIAVPARPIWQQTFDANIENAFNTFVKAFEKMLFYRLGKGATVS